MNNFWQGKFSSLINDNRHYYDCAEMDPVGFCSLGETERADGRHLGPGKMSSLIQDLTVDTYW